MNEETEVREPQIKVLNNEVREAAMLIPVESTGVAVQNFAQQVDYAKWMAQAGFAISKDLRGNVGACVAVLDMSQRWGFAPYQVARLCYQVNGMMALESQLIHAVIEKFAPLQKRLRCGYEGDGQDRKCIVTGHIKGEVDPLIYTSPRVGDIKPQNSPLWKTDVDQQLWFYSSRAWCRKYCPDILMGIYGRDEVLDSGIGANNAIDVTPAVAGLHDRLAAAAGQEGFKAGVVEAGLNGDHDPKPKRGRKAKDAGEPATPGGPAAGQPSHEHPATPGASAEPAGEPSEAGKSGGPPPPKDPQAPAAAKLPANPAEYLVYARSWLAAATTADEIHTRWGGERKLRNAIGLTSDERKPIEVEKDARMAVLEGTK